MCGLCIEPYQVVFAEPDKKIEIGHDFCLLSLKLSWESERGRNGWKLGWPYDFDFSQINSNLLGRVLGPYLNRFPADLNFPLLANAPHKSLAKNAF